MCVCVYMCLSVDGFLSIYLSSLASVNHEKVQCTGLMTRYNFVLIPRFSFFYINSINNYLIYCKINHVNYLKTESIFSWVSLRHKLEKKKTMKMSSSYGFCHFSDEGPATGGPDFRCLTRDPLSPEELGPRVQTRAVLVCMLQLCRMRHD